MKRLIFLITILFLVSPLAAQNRVPIVVDDLNWELEPPQTLAQLLSRSDSAAVVRIEGRTTTLNSRGQVVVLYNATVDRAVRLSRETFKKGQQLQFQELGGAFDNGLWIRRGFMEYYANLQPGSTYLVFLDHPSKTEIGLTWGKYGAYEILSGAVLPVIDTGEALYKELAGLRLEDLVARTEETAGSDSAAAPRKLR